MSSVRSMIMRPHVVQLGRMRPNQTLGLQIKQQVPPEAVVSITAGHPYVVIQSCAVLETHIEIVVVNTSEEEISNVGFMLQLTPLETPGAIPEDAGTAAYLFRAVAYAERQIGVEGTAFPEDSANIAIRASSWRRGADSPAWLIPGAIGGKDVLLRVQVTPNAGHLLVTVLSAAGDAMLGKEMRSQGGSLAAIDLALAEQLTKCG